MNQWKNLANQLYRNVISFGMSYFIKINNIFKVLFIVVLSFSFNSNAFSEESAKDIIKKRKSLFSQNYKLAKRISILLNEVEIEDSKKLMIRMSDNYLELLTLFPENTKEGHGTEALPIIWEEKDKFDALMKKSSDKMIKLASIIEDQDDFRAALKQYMWSSCKACHSRYRAPH